MSNDSVATAAQEQRSELAPFSRSPRRSRSEPAACSRARTCSSSRTRSPHRPSRRRPRARGFRECVPRSSVPRRSRHPRSGRSGPRCCPARSGRQRTLSRRRTPERVRPARSAVRADGGRGDGPGREPPPLAGVCPALRSGVLTPTGCSIICVSPRAPEAEPRDPPYRLPAGRPAKSPRCDRRSVRPAQVPSSIPAKRAPIEERRGRKAGSVP